jgi:hypothetical protein
MELKHFKYDKGDGVSEREVLVVHENEKWFDGIDLGHLQKDAAEALRTHAASAKLTTTTAGKEAIEIDGVSSNDIAADVKAGWRRFSRTKIV